VWPKEEEAKQLTQKRKDANDAILEEVRAPLNEHNVRCIVLTLLPMSDHMVCTPTR
jgi:hypothetical protein